MVMVAQLQEYTKHHGIVYFKRVDFMVCELYLNKGVIKKKDKNGAAPGKAEPGGPDFLICSFS